MPFHVVLYQPLIPPNTGNVARLTAAFNCQLHLIEPLGFDLSDRHLKRAGLDYWSEVQLSVHKAWPAFLESTGATRDHLWFLTTRGTTPYFEVEFRNGDFLVFGSETSGLPDEIHQTYADRRLVIPLENRKVRSLNLSSAVAMVVGEARRQENGRNQRRRLLNSSRACPPSLL